MQRTKKMVVSTSLVPVSVNSKRAKENGTVVVVNLKKKKKKQSRKMTLSRNPGMGPMATAWYRCLLDPFNNPPVRAGFGCMIDTQVHTAYVRTKFSTNGNGDFALFILPNQNQLVLLTSANLATVPTTANASLTTSGNATLLNGLFDNSRTLAMGLRIYPMIPATSVPGVISLGCAPRDALVGVAPGGPGLVANSSSAAVTSDATAPLFNKSISAVSQMPYLREHIARPSSLDFFQVTWRPTDVKDFEFSTGDAQTIGLSGTGGVQPFFSSNALLTQFDSGGSFLVATGQGLGGGVTNFYVEVVLHLECTASTDSISSTDNSSNNPEPSVASEGEFGSFETLYRRILSVLPPVDTVQGTATSLISSPIAQHYAKKYASKMLGIHSSGF